MSKSRKVNSRKSLLRKSGISKSRKVEKLDDYVLNFEKLKSRKVKGVLSKSRKVQKFDDHVFNFEQKVRIVFEKPKNRKVEKWKEKRSGKVDQ